MAKHHTAGPWKWAGGSLDGPNGETILGVQDLPERAYPENQSGALVMDNEEGDRPLLGAAPDLLKACKAALNIHTRYCDRVGAADDWARSVHLQLQAAIAKAEGVRHG